MNDFNLSNMLIRSASLADADAISHLIIHTLKKSNSEDYSPAVIEKVVQNFSPNQVAEKIKRRLVFVVSDHGCIVGTASLEHETVRSVFILPSKQKQHIGSLLMQHLETIAKEQNIYTLTVSSSITAKGFYSKLGYQALRDKYHGEERTIIMEKHL